MICRRERHLLKTKSKRTKYNELIARQQRQYDQVMSESETQREISVLCIIIK